MSTIERPETEKRFPLSLTAYQCGAFQAFMETFLPQATNPRVKEAVQDILQQLVRIGDNLAGRAGGKPENDPLVGQIYPAILREDMQELLAYAEGNDQLTDDDLHKLDAIKRRWNL